jgi:hypothetical protein
MEKKCIVCVSVFETGKHKSKKTCSKDCLRIHMDNIKEDRIKKGKEAMFNKYGVDHPSKLIDFSDKVKKSKKEKYGDENFNNREKSKNTMLKKYSVDNSMKLESSKIKSKNTKELKYGDKTFNNRVKAKETIQDKYGVDHHLQLPSILEKQINTNIEKNNVRFNLLTLKSKENLKNKNRELYNADYYFSSINHKKESWENKIERLKKDLEINNLIFKDGIEKYNKLRVKNGDVINYLKYDLLCKVCGSEFASRAVKTALVCRKCYPKENGSKIQKELSIFLSSLVGEENIYENNRLVIKPSELDFYLEKYNIAIELNGNYFHSEVSGKKNKSYHITKTQKTFDKNIKLIHIFEDEWLLKKDIVKSRIKNLLGITENKIFARKCEIKEISSFEKSQFLDKNHIQGNCVDKLRYGLFFEEELVSVMTFGKLRAALGSKVKNTENQYELIRFCSKINLNIVGSFSKLMSYFVKNNLPKRIISYADCRWSGINYEQTAYYKNGFVFIKKTPPSYYYVNTSDYLSRKHRYSMNKSSLIKKYNANPNETEFEIAVKNGFDRIWDCGTLSFEKLF